MQWSGFSQRFPTARSARALLQRRTGEVVEGVRSAAALYPSHDASAGRRIANYASFGASAAVSGIDCTCLDRDVVWVSNLAAG